jgi:uncharacterized protein (DUF983 family)
MGVEIASVGEPAKREIWPAVMNGLKCRCPKCGKGKLYRAYLKVNDTCPNCGEELFHHRADDGPAYITIVIVGHLLVGLMLHMEMTWHVDPATYLYTLLPLAIVMPLAMLPSVKGALVGFQWAQRMHGFDPDHRDPAAPDIA